MFLATALSIRQGPGPSQRDPSTLHKHLSDAPALVMTTQIYSHKAMAHRSLSNIVKVNELNFDFFMLMILQSNFFSRKITIGYPKQNPN